MFHQSIGKLQTIFGDLFVKFYNMDITVKTNNQLVQWLSNYPLRMIDSADPKNFILVTKGWPFGIKPNILLELEKKYENLILFSQ